MSGRTDPLLDAGIRGLIVNMAKKNFWRVAGWYELDDLIQDGYFCWTKVRRRYKHIKEIRHLTALFKTTYSRHIIDLANGRSEGDEVPVSQIVDDRKPLSAQWEQFLGTEPEEATVSSLLRNAPSEVKQLWRCLLSEPGREQLRQPYLKTNGRRETTNEFLCRILGLDASTVDLEGLAKAHFHGLEDSATQWARFFRETFDTLDVKVLAAS